MKTLLCPTDFSPEADNADRYAGELARRMGARLVLFHNIYEPVSGASVFYERGPTGRFNLDQEYRQAQQEKLEALCAKLRPGPDCSTRLQYGLAKDTIPQAAAQEKADMVVMAQSRSEGLRQMLAGSTLAGILQHVSCPLLIIPAQAAFRPLKRIVVASDLQGDLLAGMDLVRELASFSGSGILLLHILADEHPATRQQAQQGLNRLQESLAYGPVSCHLQTSAHLEAGLSQFCRQHQADMLVMGYQPGPFWERLLRQDPARDMAYHARLPLLIIPGRQ